MTTDSIVSSDIDYARDGKQVSFLRVPQSFNTAGWANYFIPIAVVKNGVGPTALPISITRGSSPACQDMNPDPYFPISPYFPRASAARA